MTGYLARIELRRRWRGVLLLTVLVALVVGTVLTSVAGASRSRTAFDRYLDALNPIDVALFANDPDALEAAAALPVIRDSAEIELAAIFPTEQDEETFFPMLVSLDGLLPYEYMRSPVLRGRVPDPDEPLAVALGERTARRLGKDVGDTIPMESMSRAAAESGFSDEGGEVVSDGPTFELEVAGIVREPGDISGREDDLAFTYLTPAFRDRYDGEEIGQLGGGSLVVLEDGVSLRDLGTAVGDLEVEIDSTVTPEGSRGQANPVMRAIANALLIFAGVVAAAGLVALAQAAHRGAQAALGDDHTLAALGISRRGRWLRLVAPGALAVIVGAVIAVPLAVASSWLMPVGLARRADPDPGIDVDGVVLIVGFGVAVFIGLVVVAASAALAARARTGTRALVRPSRLASVAADRGASPSVVTGLTLALGGRSSSTAASRAAVGGVAVGVLGVVAAVVFATSVDRLVGTPHLYGWGWDANIAGGDVTHLEDGLVDQDDLIADQDISAAGDVLFNLEIRVDDEPSFAISPLDLKGHIRSVIVDGREPQGPGEIALAGDTMKATGAAIGDRVAVAVGDGQAELLVTGLASLPVSSDGGSSASGSVLPRAAVDALGAECADEVSCYRNLVVDVREGADVNAVLARHVEDDPAIQIDKPVPPGEVERLTAVERLPWFLAAFLALLAVLAIAHGAATTVRRRRHDLAILRVLGMTASQVRTVVTTQIAVVSAIGAVVGSLLGIVAGRQVWRAVVDSVPLPFSPATPTLAVAAIVGVTLVLAQLAATLPRRSAGKLRTADVLRSE